MSWLTGYSYRKKITIDYTKVAATLSYFPVAVVITSDTGIGGHALATGYDIRFTASDETTLLNFERASFAIATGSCNAIFWVCIPSLSHTANTEFYIYYGKADATDGQEITATWSENGGNNYKHVYHLTQDPSGSAPQVFNSASGSADGTCTNMATANLVDGKVGKCYTFNGSDEYVNGTAIPTGDTFTVEAWCNTSGTGVSQPIAEYSDAGSDRHGIAIHSTNKPRVTYPDSYKEGGSALSTSTWYYLVSNFDGTTPILYQNASLITLGGTNASTENTASIFRIGRSANSQALYFNGYIDEVRISSVVRSATWITTCYNNQYSPGTFYSIGTEYAGGVYLYSTVTGEGVATANDTIRGSLYIASTCTGSGSATGNLGVPYYIDSQVTGTGVATANNALAGIISLVSSCSGTGVATAEAIVPRFLTYKEKYVVQSTSSIATTDNDLQDDTYASQSFTLDGSKTVLAIYVSTNSHGSTNKYPGRKAAVNVDGTDYCQMNDSATSSTYGMRNTSFWVGTLTAGDHTIKGRFASINGVDTVTVTDRTLIILVLDGDQYQYIDNITEQDTESTTFVDDAYATVTLGAIGDCKALILYATTGLHGTVNASAGTKIQIKVGGVAKTETEASKSMGNANYALSVATCYAASLSAGASTTILGQFAAVSTGITVSRSVLAVLLFTNDTIIDQLTSDTQDTATGTTLVDDDQATITRTPTGLKELLIVGQGTKTSGTATSVYGQSYGLSFDGTDVAIARSSPNSGSSCESNFVAYSVTADTNEHTIKGRFASNYGSNAAAIDKRIISAIWIPYITYLNMVSSCTGEGATTGNCSIQIPIASTVTGEGATTCNNTKELDIISSVTGVGNATAGNSEFEYISSNCIDGIGIATANNYVGIPVSSTVTGEGSATASNYTFSLLSSTVTGTGSSTANDVKAENLQVASTVTGTGTATCNDIKIGYLLVSSNATGEGSATANDVLKKLISSTSVGYGGSSSNITIYDYLPISSVCTGEGIATGVNITLDPLSSTCTGEGTATCGNHLFKSLTSSVSGEGVAPSNCVDLVFIDSSVSGFGVSTCNNIELLQIASEVSGEGYSSCVDVIIDVLISTCTGEGASTANNILFGYLASSVSGEGVATSNGINISFLSSSVVGYGFSQSHLNKQLVISSDSSGEGSSTSSCAILTFLNSTVGSTGSAEAVIHLSDCISSIVDGEGVATANNLSWIQLESSVSGLGTSVANFNRFPIWDYPLEADIDSIERTVSIDTISRTVSIDSIERTVEIND